MSKHSNYKDERRSKTRNDQRNEDEDSGLKVFGTTGP